MLDSVKISRRQSEIRQDLAELAGKENPSEDEVRKMDEMDREYRSNETRYRAALIAEDTERRDAGDELETRSEQEWSDMMGRFEIRQVVEALTESGRALTGQTGEIVSELRSARGYTGIPVPWEALEIRAGETVASGTPNPVRTAPIIDRLFHGSAAARMGASMINIGTGEMEYPVATSGAVASWQATELGDVGGPATYGTTDIPLKPDHTLGIRMKLSRKSLKQTGAALEQAVRRDMNGAMAEALDKAIFLGTGADGQPLGVISGAATYGITTTAVNATPDWGTFRSAVVKFLVSNAAATPAEVRVLARPEVWDTLDAQKTGDGGYMFEWDRLAAAVTGGNVTLNANALAAPTGDPLATTALLTTTAGGVPPIFVGTWGAVDLIRDPYSDAASGALRLTALTTCDVTVARSVQLQVLTGLQEMGT